MLHSAMKESIARIGQAIRDLPFNVRKDVLSIIKNYCPDLWMETSNRSRFEYYREQFGHAFAEEEDVNNNNVNFVKREIFEEITPEQLFAIAKKAGELQKILKEKYFQAMEKQQSIANENESSNVNTNESTTQPSNFYSSASLVNTFYKTKETKEESTVPTEANQLDALQQLQNN